MESQLEKLGYYVKGEQDRRTDRQTDKSKILVIFPLFENDKNIKVKVNKNHINRRLLGS